MSVKLNKINTLMEQSEAICCGVYELFDVCHQDLDAESKYEMLLWVVQALLENARQTQNIVESFVERFNELIDEDNNKESHYD